MGAKFQQYRGLDELGFFYCCFWVIHTFRHSKKKLSEKI
jgi:hypothetical protein